MTKPFFILHSLGASEVRAETAQSALQKAFVPLGFRDALAVIEGECIFSAHTIPSRAPFIGLAGKPLAGGGA